MTGIIITLALGLAVVVAALSDQPKKAKAKKRVHIERDFR
jgi:hypothetical protein